MSPPRSAEAYGRTRGPLCDALADRVRRLLEDSAPRDGELVDLLLADPGLTLQVLGAANRAVRGLGVPVTTLEGAVQILGGNAWNALLQQAEGEAASCWDLRWLRHAIVTSLAAGSFAEILGGVDPREARVVGLLHSLQADAGVGPLAKHGVPERLLAALNAAPPTDENRRDLWSVLGMAHRMATGLGASGPCCLESDSESGASPARFRDVGEILHDRVAQEVADGLTVLGVLLGEHRLDLTTFQESLARQVLGATKGSALAGLAPAVRGALLRIRRAASEASALRDVVAMVRRTQGLDRVVLVLEEAGEAMVAATDEEAPFYVRRRDITASASAQDLLDLVHREQDAAHVSRGMGFDALLHAFGCAAVLAVPIRSAGQPVGTLLVPEPKGSHVAAALGPTLEVLAEAAGFAIERAQLSRRSFLLTQRITKDDLTGVFQRTHFMELLEAEIRVANRYRRPLAMVMLDVDRFKDWNDSYGHAMGDRLLKDVARAIEGCSREGDLVGRYGGDEFMVVLPGQNGEQAQAYAERVRQKVEALGTVMTEVCYTLKLSVSLGVASVTEHPADAGTLMARADHALYRAKERGRNRVHAEPK